MWALVRLLTPTMNWCSGPLLTNKPLTWTAGVQRQPSVVVTSWVDAGWHEAVIDSPVRYGNNDGYKGGCSHPAWQAAGCRRPTGFRGLICIDLGSEERPKVDDPQQRR